MSSFSNNINGFLIIDKPQNYTSRDIVNIVSKKFQTKKVGHTGTLDPLATGLLILCLGKYTKLSELITSYDKEYIAEVILGISTDTYDITGNIIKEMDASKITEQNIKDCLKNFIGKQKQQVPIYSAVKVNGRKLYDYARKSQEVDLPIKDIEIKSLELIDIKYENKKVIFKMKCLVSKGTYIRSLVNDIGNNLNLCATMSNLRRTKQSNFTIDKSYTLEDIENNKYELLSIKDIIPNIKVINIENIDECQKKLILNGNEISNENNYNICLFMDKDKEIAIYNKNGDKLKPYKML